MGIFKRNEPADQAAAATQTAEGRPKQTANLLPPFVSPGVVPPPAAIMFEMTPAESGGRRETDTGSLVAEKVRTASDAQQRVQERVRVAVQRARSASTGRAVRRAPPQQAAWAPNRQSFDPSRAAQAGLLNLAWSWQQAGAPIRAIHAYMQVLCRYPDTPGAAAAVADLVELSEILTNEGQYHLALSIYEELEQVL